MRKTALALLLVSTSAPAWEYQATDLQCLTQNIYFEAGSESALGKQAVAEVVMNRVNSRRFPNSVCEVVYQPYQFSWTLNQSLTVRSQKAWKESTAVAVKVLNNIDLLYIRADHYYAPAEMKPRGRVPKWATDRLPDFHLEGHIFYYLED